jgi:predicted outer membrane repeat protein
MDYFRVYSLSSDDGVVAAWDSVASAAEIPSVRQLLAERGAEIFPEFAKQYAEIRVLPRSARRALQRTLAHSRELANIPAEWRRKLAYSVAGAALLLALGGAAQAGTIFVTAKTPADISDGDLKCSLNEAIENANNGNDITHPDCTNATAGPNTIMLPKGTVLLGTPPGLGSYTGTSLITSDITIHGSKTKIMRLPSAPAFRLFEVYSGGTLTLDSVTLSGGDSASYGGAVYNNYGSLIIKNSIITKNSAKYGGGIYTHNGYTYISGSVITGNTATGSGGGVYSSGLSATLVMKNSTVSKNSAQVDTGGVGSHRGTASIENSVVTGNTAGFRGAGVYAVAGTLTISGGSVISKNTAGNFGGGVSHRFYVTGVTHIYDSTITGNKALDGGGVWEDSTTTVIDNSTIAKNSAGRNGGGVYHVAGSLTLTASTVTGNKAVVRGGGVDTSPVNFTNTSTITKNKAATDPDIHYH